MARKSRRTRRLRVVNPDCAGIDIGKDRHLVAVDPERTEEPVRSFGAFTRDLEAMAAWLRLCGVTKVAMESTSVCWISVKTTSNRGSTPTRSGASTGSSRISTAKPESSGSSSSRRCKTNQRKTKSRQTLRNLLLKRERADWTPISVATY